MARLENAIRQRSATTAEERRSKQARLGRVIEIGGRYTRNIASSKRFANDVNERGVDSARGRSYSQNTYMGINAG